MSISACPGFGEVLAAGALGEFRDGNKRFHDLSTTDDGRTGPGRSRHHGPRARRPSSWPGDDVDRAGQTGSLRVPTAAGALMARPISARTTPTTNAITATPKATTDVNSEACRNAESIAVPRFGSSRASSA